jgi:hypothetical protein
MCSNFHQSRQKRARSSYENHNWRFCTYLDRSIDLRDTYSMNAETPTTAVLSEVQKPSVRMARTALFNTENSVQPEKAGRFKKCKHYAHRQQLWRFERPLAHPQLLDFCGFHTLQTVLADDVPDSLLYTLKSTGCHNETSSQHPRVTRLFFSHTHTWNHNSTRQTFWA